MNYASLMFQNELRKVFLIAWHYKFNLWSELITLAINFFGMIFLMNSGTNSQHGLGPELLGYIIWVYASYLLNASHTLTLEGRSGTLEQLYLSPASPLIIIGSALCATLISTSWMVIGMSIFVYIVSGIAVPISLTLLPIIGCTLLELIGVGFIIAGTALIYKNVAGLEYLLTSSLLYLNGSMISIEHLPAWLQTIAHRLPTTHGIMLLRNVLNNNTEFLELVQTGDFLSLVLNAILYVLLGISIFNVCSKYAQETGCLGTY